MNKLQENMRRFGTKNLQEQENQSTAVPRLFGNQAEIYKLMRSGKATAADIAKALKAGIGIFNDDEAVIQDAVAAIKDRVQLSEVEKILKSKLVPWLIENFADPTGVVVSTSAVGDYIEDHHGNKQIPSIMTSLKRLGLFTGIIQRQLTKFGINDTSSWKKDGDYYVFKAEDLSV